MSLLRCRSTCWIGSTRSFVRCEKSFLHVLTERGSWHRLGGSLWKPYRGISPPEAFRTRRRDRWL